MYKLIRWFLFLFEPEQAHHLSCAGLNLLYKLKLKFLFPKVHERPVKVMGIEFDNPIGLAAGYDKNARYFPALSMLGFGFIEVGTVTPRPQPGNPKPRIFRLNELNAIINRPGLNNDGVDKVCQNIKNANYSKVLGISISKNNDVAYEDAVKDYIYCLQRVYPIADYIALDLSCPNVPNFKAFLAGENFNSILKNVKKEQLKLKEKYNYYKPIAVKISPDLNDETIKVVAGKINEYKMDGLIACNTSTSRDIKHPLAHEKGGLSGPPVFHLMLHTVKEIRKHLDESIPIIAVGGIDSAQKALQVKNAGADLIQVYTGLVYHGPSLVGELAQVY